MSVLACGDSFGEGERDRARGWVTGKGRSTFVCRVGMDEAYATLVV